MEEVKYYILRVREVLDTHSNISHRYFSIFGKYFWDEDDNQFIKTSYKSIQEAESEMPKDSYDTKYYIIPSRFGYFGEEGDEKEIITNIAGDFEPYT